ncbi:MULTISPECIES: ABC transporter ATP-binding protein [unclassified Paenibacillus]|uniref:ABC transporter ATP-binding protein n=1 Tax=unclassified Paenibacillus TaxID=185978 RepID=UPI00240721D2|nr:MULTISPECIES: ABC transporter ATP-binding protein [unclassified Paenibacillus]MDF9842050.1 peptide/nickel transport system ATP-binding protein [Paenibacillus sp. PastF-2]MDF9848696.1 peptide/nickel transport system ATP-binding protein [Paenibacillus sp. PastM-2]MDF9855265.1 peptide/nickel transport system ATP-binding protein [Paenibacillus sp. PastF-1]MDH6480536.1 peptide/nickel transport system ATP-binding protein [Paenibacillus sp. PastH-2]MDH6507963.1 peptide/nickel transport system ATP-
MGERELLLAVDDLHTYFHTERGTVRAVNGVSFELERGERLAVVGESGSGKSAMAMSLLQLLAYPGKVVSGSVRLEGEDLLQMSERQLNEIRGGKIGTVFQDPMTSLDPVMTVEDQLVHTICRHTKLGRKQAAERAVELLRQVGIPDPQVRVKNYPYELSGGMRQRVLIAMSLSCHPKLILADEPTTALDVTIQAQIVELLKNLSAETGCAVLFITHDLGLVARFAQKVAVMYAGRIVEYGTVHEIFANPQHPYTQSLLSTIPRADERKRERLLQIDGFPPDMSRPLAGCSFRERCLAATAVCGSQSPELTMRSDTHSAACFVKGGLGKLEQLRPEYGITEEERYVMPEGAEPVLQVKSLKKRFETASLFKKKRVVHAVDGIDITLMPGETLGVVGESGCGKSTMARMLLRLEEPSDGNIFVEGVDIAHMKGERLSAFRSKVQMVFQDPYSSFNPKITIRQIIGEPLTVMKIGTRAEREQRIRELIRTVGLDVSYLERYPNQLSGGQRQRIGIARALALSPSIIVADEPTSALDVSVRAQVINLLAELRDRLGISIVFISHDLSVVRHISDTIAVMYLGKVVETGPAAEVFENPKHPYTKALLAASPLPDPELEDRRIIEVLTGELPSPANPPGGCRFSTRCPLVERRCREEMPALDPAGESRKVACFFAS